MCEGGRMKRRGGLRCMCMEGKCVKSYEGKSTCGNERQIEVYVFGSV